MREKKVQKLANLLTGDRRRRVWWLEDQLDLLESEAEKEHEPGTRGFGAAVKTLAIRYWKHEQRRPREQRHLALTRPLPNEGERAEGLLPEPALVVPLLDRLADKMRMP